MGTRRLMGLNRTPLAVCVAAAFATGLAVVSGVVTAGTPGQPDRSGEARPAAVLPVTSCADDGSPGTLREVVAGAASGDTVDLTQLKCSTITLLSGQLEIGVDDLTIEGPGRDALTVDGNQASNDEHTNNGRVFQHSGHGTLAIEDLTVANGLVYSAGAYGGCINSPDGAVSLINSAVIGCRAITFSGGSSAHGGGISAGNSIGEGGIFLDNSVVSGNVAAAVFNEDSNQYGYISAGGGLASRGTVTIVDSQITGNRVEATLPFTYELRLQQAGGGGISTYFQPLTITNSVISGNFAGCNLEEVQCYQAVAGGVRALGGLTIDSSTISDNVTEAVYRIIGVGIEVEGYGVQITNTTISNNQARPGSSTFLNWGGGILLSNSTADIRYSTFNGNIGTGRGGAIFLDNSAATVSNATISGNTVIDQGGGVFLSYSDGAALTLENSTVTLNGSTGEAGGGGIVDYTNRYGATVLQSSIVAGNIITADTPIFDADLGVSAGSVDGANNLIVAASGVALPSDTISTDPMLGPLQDNGGPTWTHALLPASPAIDAGNNAAKLDFDQRGEGYPRVSGFAADIGAFEVQQGPVGSPPNAADDSYTMTEHTTLTVDPPGVLGNDSDPDGDPLTATLVTGPSNGTLTLNPDGSFTYTPNDDFVGTDSFTYEANDGQLDSSVATVSITVKQDPADRVFADGFDGP